MAVTDIDSSAGTAPSRAVTYNSGKKRKKKGIHPVVWLLIGILLLSYPVAATLWNDARLEKQAELYNRGVERIEPKAKKAQYLEEARAYNNRLRRQGNHAMPPFEPSPGLNDYLSQLDAPQTHGVMARIKIESLGIDLPVYHTSRDEVLYQGAGHMFGSSLPVGGEGMNSVITAHTGMYNATMFDNLPRIKDGEVVTIEVMGETLYYKVDGRQVVKPDEYDAVTYEPGQDKLTLITCTPYGINTDRLLVNAVRFYPDEPIESEQRRIAWSWWMYLNCLVILVALLALLALFTRRRRRKKQVKNSANNAVKSSARTV